MDLNRNLALMEALAACDALQNAITVLEERPLPDEEMREQIRQYAIPLLGEERDRVAAEIDALREAN
jgi:hypothetical protein